MDRPNYLKNYFFNWDAMEVVCNGMSSLEANHYLNGIYDTTQVDEFLNGYGFDVSNPIEIAELFGIFQESLQFIKRYFLKEGNPEGLPLSIPHFLFAITNIEELFLIANGKHSGKLNIEDSLWAAVVLKVMHTILHADKDLRYRYFNVIQTQIFDRFYKYINRDSEDNLFLGKEDYKIPLYDFQTKAQKTRDSIIIKLLHKQENVAEEVFDRIGLRFVTYNRLDALRVIQFLYNNYIVMINNIKPSRSQNNLVDIRAFKDKIKPLIKDTIKNAPTEEEFYQLLEKAVTSSHPPSDKKLVKNNHTLEEYRAIHFTGRQLIKYRNPFMSQFNELRKLALKTDSDLGKKLLSLDTSSVSQDVRFFYPYEIQITDLESHKTNTKGEASHDEYKKLQVISAMKRIFKPIIDFKEIKLP